MEYSPTLCFAGFNSKIRKFPKKEEKKSNCSSLCRDKKFCVMTNAQANRKGTLSRQKTACRDRKWEESNNSAKTKKVYVATRFFQQDVNTRKNQS